MNKKTPVLSAIAIGAGLFLATALPLSASAHVSLTTNTAEAGSYTIVTFKVPNESDTAGTNKVTISLPTDTPFASVSYVPVAGWTTELNEETLPEPVAVGESEITDAVTSVTFTADAGSEIVAGQLQMFSLSLGPVPDTGSIVLAAEQFYDDGTIVSWSDTEADAEHPAPVLYVNDAPAADHHGAAAEDDEHAADDAAAATPAATDDTLARILGIGGLVVGAVGIVLAVTARRSASTSASTSASE